MIIHNYYQFQGHIKTSPNVLFMNSCSFFPTTQMFFCSLGHPWILFYTNQSLDSLTYGFKKQTRSTFPSPQLIDMIEMESERNVFSLNENSTPMLPHDEDCCMVDVLALAISRVRISEPKRSRICSPTNNPAQQEHSSNITIKSLCRAF